MADGVLTEFPDLTEVLDLHAAVGIRLGAVVGGLPDDPAELTLNLDGAAAALAAALPADPRALLESPRAGFETLRGLLPAEPPEELAGLLEGLGELLARLEPLREILDSPDGLRDLRDVVFEKAGDPAELLRGLLAELGKLFPAESLAELRAAVDLVREFETRVPDDPVAVGDFVARLFLGVPLDLLAGPLGAVQGFHGRIDGLLDADALGELPGQVSAAAAALTAAAKSLRTLDPTSAADFQAARAALTAARAPLKAVAARLDGLATGFADGLQGLDPGVLVSDLRGAFEGLPEIRVAQIDTFVDHVVEPLRQINRQLDELTPEELEAAFTASRAGFAERLEGEVGLSQVRELMVRPFRELGELLAELDPAPLREGLDGVLSGATGEAARVAGLLTDLVGRVREIFAQAGSALEALGRAREEAEGALTGLIGELGNAVAAVPVEDFRQLVADVLGQVEGLVAQLGDQAAPAAEVVAALREAIEGLRLRPAVEPAVVAVRDITGQVEKIDLTLMADGEAFAFRVSARVLEEIDLGPVRERLLQELDAVDPRQLTRAAAAGYRELVDRLGELDPAQLLAFLEEPFGEARSALAAFDPATLLEPAIARLDRARRALGGFSPERFVDPLVAPWEEVLEAFDQLAPSVLLAPLAEPYADLRALVDKLEVEPLLDELSGLFDDWVEEVMGGVAALGDAFSDAGELKSYLDGLGGGPGMVDLGYLPGTVLEPAAELYDKVLALLDAVPEAAFVAAFGELHDRFVSGLREVSPAALAARLDRRFQNALAAIDVGANRQLLAPLRAANLELVAAYDGIDGVRVRAELQADFSELGELVEGLDPEPLIAPLRQRLAGLSRAASELAGGLDPAELAPLFAPAREKIEQLVPSFLSGELDLEALRAGLDELHPRRLAAEVDAEYEAFLIKIAAFGEVLAAQLPLGLEALSSGTTAFLPDAIGEALGEVLEPLRQHLTAIDPAPLIADLESRLYEPLRRNLENLDPRRLVAELDLEVRLAELDATLAALIDALRQLQASVADLWQRLLESLDALDPAALGGELSGTFDGIRQILDDLDLTAVFDALDQAMERLRDDLDRALQDVETELEAMFRALPA